MRKILWPLDVGCGGWPCRTLCFWRKLVEMFSMCFPVFTELRARNAACGKGAGLTGPSHQRLAQWQVQSGNGAPGPVQAEGWSTPVLPAVGRRIKEQCGPAQLEADVPRVRTCAVWGRVVEGVECFGWWLPVCTPSHYTLMCFELGPSSVHQFLQ